MESPIACAVIGYGPQHNFGWAHAAWIAATPELRLAAVCDLDPARTEAARREFPGIATHNDVAALLADDEIQLVSIVTPHFTHCPLTLQSFAAAKHVVVEKAMCLTAAEATAMIEAGRRAGKMLAVHHNRRHDGNFRTLRELVAGGAIGDVFHLELAAGGWSCPDLGWYTEKAKSGGGFYYWGPHAIDWVLTLIPHRVVGVNGFFHKRVWHDRTNEDQTQAILRFENGTIADVFYSHIDAAGGRPLWRILGTKGAIRDTGVGGLVGYQHMVHGPSGGGLTVVKCEGSRCEEQTLAYHESDWDAYWQGIADHLLRGAPLEVSGEDGRRTIAVFEAAEKSSRTGQTEPVEWE